MDNQFRSQLTCFKFGFMNPWWAFELEENSKANKTFPEAVTKRSQDLPDLFCPTGAIWITKPSVLEAEKTFILRIIVSLRFRGKRLWILMIWVTLSLH